MEFHSNYAMSMYMRVLVDSFVGVFKEKLKKCAGVGLRIFSSSLDTGDRNRKSVNSQLKLSNARVFDILNHHLSPIFYSLFPL